ncbi:AAA family ATPase [Enterococcus faecalis]|uniref:AAA family ATPase n=1 Tax=Enterococcus TaxID=1350 RepID=UPI000709575F|nr:ATP-binding protein [Enterococcus faecalis]KXF71374.1 AAA family ATPase [Enterococcus faecalis]KXF73872.1 AAA family ATPase [Enterococcus faecalis]MBC2811814.1 AAA family ATPase [Enterococcus faecalis]MBC2816067.1 AAA family ATPase [Enterococcus faecalis]MBC2818599.1 AAA family ATPase [Enterococcus faecalis]
MRKNVLNYLPDLVEASFSNDNNSLESIILSMIRILNKEKETKNIAEKLSKILSKHQAGLYPDQKIMRSYDQTQEFFETNIYLSYKVPSRSLSELVLNPDLLNRLEDIISSYRNKDRLKELGIKYSQKVILNGSPGTGKSSIGEALAYELNLEFVLVNVPSLFSSYLGNSGKTISKLFTSIESKQAVIVFDEFDSLATSRDLTNDVGEMRRVVNAVLTSLDNWNGNGLIIATTNEKENLDNAIWRRFDDRIDVTLPDMNNRIKLWDKYCQNNLNRQELLVLSEFSENFSPAEIEILSQQGLRLKVLKNKNIFLTILGQISNEKVDPKNKKGVVKYLKQNFPDISTREIGELIRISKSSVQRYLKEL